MLVKDFRFKKTQNDYNLIGKIKVKVLIVLAVATSLILTTQLVFATSLATDGEKLSQIELEINALEQENTDLKVKIAQISSLKTLSEKAGALGFTEPAQIITP